MKLEASSDLLISQWRAAPLMQGMTQGMIDVIQEDVANTLDELYRMLDVDTAAGVWLDFLAKRVGIERPLVINEAGDDRFGFRGPTQAMNFDVSPFKGGLANAARLPLNDTVFRKMVKARGILDKSGGDFFTFERATLVIDPDSICKDNRDMTINIQTELAREFRIADTIGALPRSAGITLVYNEEPTFGFKGAGEGFDRVRMR